MRWETDTRYMQAHLQQDLLGDWVLLIANGGLNSRRGRLRTVVLASRAAAEPYLAALHKRRIQHGYRLVDDCGPVQKENASLDL